MQFYNDIQKLDIQVFGDNGEVLKTKKFVKRGSIKDETLGACLHFTCILAELPRRKKDIAEFMKLQTNGISNGISNLRELHQEGKINI